MKIAIISGKGGTGKSSVTSAFVHLAQDALAIDCDVDAANLYLIFHPEIKQKIPFISAQQALVDSDRCIGCGICAEHCHFKAIQMEDDKAKIDEIACEGCQLCQHLCPQDAIQMIAAQPSYIYEGPFRFGHMVYGRLAPGEENSGKLISRLREYAAEVMQAQNKTLAILDGPPGIGCPVISTITGVNRIVIVTEPSLSGISDLKRVHELALNFTKDIHIIVNKCDLDPQLTLEIDRWSTSVGTPVIGHIPFDKNIVEAQLSAQSIIEYAPQAKASLALTQAYQQLQV
jgi:MinD superfamily P-loop ATPase